MFIFSLKQPTTPWPNPVKIPYSGEVKALQIVDVDGDGLQDLLMVNWDSPNAFRFRLQAKSHQLEPESYF